MARKSASIIKMIERTNEALDRNMNHHMDPHQQVGFRQGLAAALEWVLLENGVYHGFSYTEQAGVERNADGVAVQPFTCQDETRRFYHTHPKLK